MEEGSAIIGKNEGVLITGASGFLGPRVLERLLEEGYQKIRCFVRPSAETKEIEALRARKDFAGRVEIREGNLLSPEDCMAAAEGMAVIFHLAAARGEKSIPEAFLNSVVTTRNLLEAARNGGVLQRFVNISSFSVYSNRDKKDGRLLDESSPVEQDPGERGDAYTFAKTSQDDLVEQYGEKYGIPYVMVRPGYVYGPGNEGITGRVGISTFGFFMHLGGGNSLPLTYVDNCAEAIVLAGLTAGIEGETFNVVDDDLPSSRRFLGLYKKRVKRFGSVYLPHWVSYLMCWTWEAYSKWSEGQLPPTYNRRMWHAYWKRTEYSNQKLKKVLGWSPRVSSKEALDRFFASCKQKEQNA